MSQCRVRRLSLVFREGFSKVRTTTTGLGAGVSRNNLVGFGAAQTSGVTQSSLSLDAAPPEAKKLTGPATLAIIAGIISLGALGSMNTGAVLWIGICVAAGYLLRQRFIYNRDVFPSVLKAWEDTFMCNRCGERFVTVL